MIEDEYWDDDTGLLAMPLEEMATVKADEEIGIRIQINVDPGRVGVPYFKVFNEFKTKKHETRVARLHFMNSGMEYHKDEYLDWEITNKDVKRIKEVLKARYVEDNPDISNWDMAKYLWNLEYQFFGNSSMDKYFNGELDEKFKDHPSYVPSTTPIPDTWEYNPPKGKGKRK